jgi:GT2 family glycosyltransferase
MGGRYPSGVPRPSVDVVVPFLGEPAHLEELRARLARLRIGPGDSVVVVDNTPGGEPSGSIGDGGVRVIRATGRATPGFARNRGAALGGAQWLVFIDADTSPSPDLLDRYFDPPPRDRTGLLGGGVLDEAVPASAGAAARYQYLRGAMSQEDTLRHGRWGYPKTANVACRRSAFEAAGRFREDIRAAEDADLAYRLRTAGWEVERRDGATVVHRSRQTTRDFIAQKLLHGAGGAWLERQYPGSHPSRGLAGLVWWGVRAATAGLVAAAWERDRDRAVWALFDPLDLIAWELGRSLPNQRPVPERSRWRHVLERPR